MSKTACWGTNQLVQCAWISFGYGSYYDLSRFWIGLEAAKVLARRDMGPPNTNSWFGRVEELSKLPPRLRMKRSAWHIHIPDNPELALEWWIEIEKEFGKYEVGEGEPVGVPKEEIEIFKRIHCMVDVESSNRNSYFTYYFNQNSKTSTTTPFMLAWTGKAEELNEMSRDPNRVALEELMKDDYEPPYTPRVISEDEKAYTLACEEWEAKYGPEIIPSQTPWEIWNHKDPSILCRNYEYGCQSINIPKNYYALGGFAPSHMVDGAYHETYGYVSPPPEWLMFGGYLRQRRMEGSGGARNPHRTYNRDDDAKSDRNYKAPPRNWFIFGGPLPKNHINNRRAHDDIYNNPSIP